ncbi:MAG: FAD:protein FMN transferase [Gemmatimonadales bacterium]
MTLVERSTVLMGTELRAAVWAPSRGAAINAIEAAFAHVKRADRLLSTWHPSEITHLNNAAPDRPVRISPELVRVLREVQHWVAATGGAFDPAIGALVDAWDLRGEGRRPEPAALNAALAASGIKQFRLVGDSAAIRRSPRSWIDTGGFGKGWALRRVQAALERHGVASGLINFGGQVMALGRSRDAEHWTVAVANPSERQCAVRALQLTDRSVATTAQSERFVEVDGAMLGHVLDPRTGRPVEPWGSVTVISNDPMVADILSTALFVMGPEQGAAWLDRHPSVAALWLIEREGGVQARWNAAMKAYLKPAEGKETCLQ